MDPSQTNTSTPSLTPTGTGGPSKPPVNATVPSNMEWTGCRGFGILQIAPLAIYQGTTPQGWDTNHDSPFNQMTVDVFMCERISWGAFERGPIYLVQDWHTNFTEPTACLDHGNQDFTSRYAMQTIWFSDPEVANYARQVYGLPAYAANFTFTRTPVAPAGSPHDWTWRWTRDGVESRATFHALEPGFNSTGTFVSRVYWFNGQGASYMDFSRTYDSTNVGVGWADGALHAPMMWGTYGPPEFAGTQTNLEDNASLSATIARFGDTGCTQPL